LGLFDKSDTHILAPLRLTHYAQGNGHAFDVVLHQNVGLTDITVSLTSLAQITCNSFSMY